ncbi:acyltransferase family protein [Luteolibacter sp. GHJ8]|uniref:Acyltransferase family protein n=1 Tax=Luteolibacter rhizosphaerae TaxID=2989719 RepID=A0ABT3G5F0_9BACT|nr:acyltransferase family protein [Luteolibacter rhizosphaerae]MCW1914799.1 acyltransferase family protein [Luteolibacter rhizosphaerae]
MISAKSVESLASPSSEVGAATVVAGPVAKKSQRFFHLDALRACLMFWGILVHTSTVEHSKFFRGCAEVSGLVRMEAFFIISGFLAYMLLQKYGGAATVKKRLVAIGVPFIAALVLLNPVTNYLVFVYHNHPLPFADYLAGKGTAGGAGPMNWHLHLWFLVALFVYSLLAPLLGRMVDAVMAGNGSRNTRRTHFFSGEFKFLAICLVVTAACLGSRVCFEAVKPLLPEDARYVIRSIGNFLPFYTLGMVLFASTNLRAIFSKAHWIQIALSCGLLFLAHQQAGANPGRLEEVSILASQTYLALTLSSLLFWIAGKLVKRESTAVRFLSDAAYSVYLFHFLAIYLFAFLFRPLHSQVDLMLVLVAASTFGALILLHAFVIRRVPVLAFLFNGKPLKRAP